MIADIFRKIKPSRSSHSKIHHCWDDVWRKGDIPSGEMEWKQCKNCGAEKTLDDEIFRTIVPEYCGPRV